VVVLLVCVGTLCCCNKFCGLRLKAFKVFPLFRSSRASVQRAGGSSRRDLSARSGSAEAPQLLPDEESGDEPPPEVPAPPVLADYRENYTLSPSTSRMCPGSDPYARTASGFSATAASAAYPPGRHGHPMVSPIAAILSAGTQAAQAEAASQSAPLISSPGRAAGSHEEVGASPPRAVPPFVPYTLPSSLPAAPGEYDVTPRAVDPVVGDPRLASLPPAARRPPALPPLADHQQLSQMAAEAIAQTPPAVPPRLLPAEGSRDREQPASTPASTASAVTPEPQLSPLRLPPRPPESSLPPPPLPVQRSGAAPDGGGLVSAALLPPALVRARREAESRLTRL